MGMSLLLCYVHLGNYVFKSNIHKESE